MGLAPQPGPLGGLWDGHLDASRDFLTLLCHLPEPLLSMPGGEDAENGEKLKVGGRKPGRADGPEHCSGSNLLLISPLAQGTPEQGSVWCVKLRVTWCLETQQVVRF